jgi:hypothetical protein
MDTIKEMNQQVKSKLHNNYTGDFMGKNGYNGPMKSHWERYSGEPSKEIKQFRYKITNAAGISILIALFTGTLAILRTAVPADTTWFTYMIGGTTVTAAQASVNPIQLWDDPAILTKVLGESVTCIAGDGIMDGTNDGIVYKNGTGTVKISKTQTDFYFAKLRQFTNGASALIDSIQLNVNYKEAYANSQITIYRTSPFGKTSPVVLNLNDFIDTNSLQDTVLKINLAERGHKIIMDEFTTILMNIPDYVNVNVAPVVEATFSVRDIVSVAAAADRQLRS